MTRLRGAATTDPDTDSDLGTALEPALREALTGMFGVPEFVLPWIDRLLEPDELRLVAALAAGPLTLPAAVAAMGIVVSPAFFDRAVRRAVIDRPTPDVVALADFADRLEIWTLFEGWKDLPSEVRRALGDWQLARYIDGKRAQIESLKAGEQPVGGARERRLPAASRSGSARGAGRARLPVAVRLPGRDGRLPQAVARLPAL